MVRVGTIKDLMPIPISQGWACGPSAHTYIIASEASSVTNCANLRFLVYNYIYIFIYIYIYLYIYMSPYVLFGPAWAPRNGQRANVGPAG